MGTTYSVKIVSFSPLDEPKLQADMQMIVSRIDQLMSNWKQDSEVSRFGRLASDETINLSPETREVLEITLDVARKTNGALDPTVSPMVELFGFGTKTRQAFPEESAIEAMLAKVGFRHLDLQDSQLKKNRDGLTLNLGAVAKGYALDAIASYLSAQGMEHYLIEIGRELRAEGKNLHGLPWRVAIENPDSEGNSPLLKIVDLSGKSIATSGDYRQYFEHEGRQYSHIIDPRTGWPIAPRVTLASVIASSCAVADAWSTACMVLSPEESIAQMNQDPDLECLLVVRQDDGSFSIQMSQGMEDYFSKLETP